MNIKAREYIAGALFGIAVALLFIPRGVEIDRETPVNIRQSMLDSLVTLAGPVEIVPIVYNPRLPDFIAYVDRENPDFIYLTRALLRRAKQERIDHVFVHEYGHVMDLRGAVPWEVTGEVLAAAVAVNTTGYMDPEEVFADAFRACYCYLREVESRPDVAPVLAVVLEAAVPGMSAICEWLVKQPIFIKHPLNLDSPSGPRSGV